MIVVCELWMIVVCELWMIVVVDVGDVRGRRRCENVWVAMEILCVLCILMMFLLLM
jgi:hypothetical protein